MSRYCGGRGGGGWGGRERERGTCCVVEKVTIKPKHIHDWNYMKPNWLVIALTL